MSDPAGATVEDPAIASTHLSPALLDRFGGLVTRDPTHEETRDAVALFTGNVVSAVAECGPEDVTRAVEHARTAQREWGTVTPRPDPWSSGTFTTWYSPGVTGSPFTQVRERDVESPRLRSGHSHSPVRRPPCHGQLPDHESRTICGLSVLGPSILSRSNCVGVMIRR